MAVRIHKHTDQGIALRDIPLIHKKMQISIFSFPCNGKAGGLDKAGDIRPDKHRGETPGALVQLGGQVWIGNGITEMILKTAISGRVVGTILVGPDHSPLDPVPIYKRKPVCSIPFYHVAIRGGPVSRMIIVKGYRSQVEIIRFIAK